MSGSEQHACKNSALVSPAAGHVVGVALSAGGLAPLLEIVSMLPATFPAAVVVVQHVASTSLLPMILQHRVRLAVKFAEAGESLLPATIYVPPADRHIVVTPVRTIALPGTSRLRFQRPSADWLFRSIAASFQEEASGVVLSGRLDDGARGITCVRRSGGRVIVQDPGSCPYASMPRAAIATGCADAVLAPHEIAPALLAALQHRNLPAATRAWEEPFAAA